MDRLVAARQAAEPTTEYVPPDAKTRVRRVFLIVMLVLLGLLGVVALVKALFF
jgi:hypothetical protein